MTQHTIKPYPDTTKMRDRSWHATWKTGVPGRREGERVIHLDVSWDKPTKSYEVTASVYTHTPGLVSIAIGEDPFATLDRTPAGRYSAAGLQRAVNAAVKAFDAEKFFEDPRNYRYGL